MRNGARIAFENTFMPNGRNQTPQGSHEGGVSNAGRRGTAHIGSSSQISFQDNINPDDMTYEELLDLGEAIGSQSRGLSKERIALLPVSKYRKGSFLLWKRSRDERCVICQMNYKRGEKLMTLPCKHIYHADCVSRWLSINKVCPVCYAEVSDAKPAK
ncbi:hypothetical protein Syun_017436 [Stephania yunnanensis]|uniref:RING-type domain-containing protein n=1 Tax=Stephania yunnanensis TaxID=152371 RepID=A0AAP0J6X3_9MAGN